LQLTLAPADDGDWQLARVDLVLDGTDLASVEVPAVAPRADRAQPAAAETPAPRPRLWSGQVAPGPHDLIAWLFFRPRSPAGAELVRVQKSLRFDQPIHPLVLLITPVRPSPAPREPALPAQLSFAPSPRPL
jgi:hypothetical protein